ncbi:MAG: SLC13 family permease [Alphaproteobacteria bacterium]|nr:SLC13 family permease [Alphaproteobacteria bacterium]
MADSSTQRFGLSHGFALIATLAAAVLVAAPLWTDTPGVLPGAGVILFAIANWATGALPQHITALVMFLVAVVFAIAPPNVVFSGFHASATWLVFGGFVISLAAQRSGLATRIVQALMNNLPGRYMAMAGGLAVAGVLLSFIMPSASGRAVLMAPLAVALADRLGFAENTRARFGLVLAAGWGTTIPAFGILPSNVVNMAFVGASEGIFNISFTYFGYTVLNFPVLGLVGMAIVVLLIGVLFGAEPKVQSEAEMQTRWSPDERRLMGIMLVALAFWMTDSLHGISPAWVALAAALLCVTPGVGVLPASVMNKDINYGPWLFVAGVIAVGAIANHTGVGGAMGDWLLAHVPLTRDGGIVTFYEIFAISAAVGLVTTFPAAPPIVTSFSDAIAQATGWPLESVLLAQVPSWMVYPFPHEAPPVAIAMALGGVPMREGARLLIPYFVVGLIVVLPLQYLWGKLLGVYP